MTDFFKAAFTANDAQIVAACVNQGIDSRLEGFTRSEFRWLTDEYGGCKLIAHIHPAELQILLRRLVELEEKEDNESAGSLADCIVYVKYGKEL